MIRVVRINSGDHRLFLIVKEQKRTGEKVEKMDKKIFALKILKVALIVAPFVAVVIAPYAYRYPGNNPLNT